MDIKIDGELYDTVLFNLEMGEGPVIITFLKQGK